MRETHPNGFREQNAARRRFLKSMLFALPALALQTPVAAQAALTEADIRGHLTALGRQFDLRRRFQWTESTPRLDRLRAASVFTRLTIHHTGTVKNVHQDIGMVATDIENVMVGHRNRNFGDIGYHFILDRAGRVWEGRSLRFIGAHVSSENEENIGVMLLGNFENQRPSDPQLQTLHRFTQALRTRFAIPAWRVYGHRDLGHTLCPGRYLYGYLGDIRTS